MKTILFAAALALGGAATAGTHTATHHPGHGDSTVAPGNAAPERDARGIPVISDPATAPAGVNGPVPAGPAVPAANQQAAFAPQASTENYPACSATVTDNCVQTYEGRRRPR